MSDVILITGASGLVGGGVLRKMLEYDGSMRAYALVRDEIRWRANAARSFGHLAERVTPVRGDVTIRGLGLDFNMRHRIAREATGIVHCAADTSFSRTLSEARLANTEGTREMLSLARVCGRSRKFVYVSTAYVAGRRCGVIREKDNGTNLGWVNSYERSKYEAEVLVRASGTDWVIFRPSTIVCDTRDGRVSQINAVHRALRIYHRGLAAMMPGNADDLLDSVPADYVSGAIARLSFDSRASRRTLHLCAGNGAITIGDLLDSAYELWSSDPAWRRKGVERPILADLDTYNLFTKSVIETGDARLAAILSSLSHFIPQLALSKRFDTTVADALVGRPAPVVSSYWKAMIAHLMASHWRSVGAAA